MTAGILIIIVGLIFFFIYYRERQHHDAMLHDLEKIGSPLLDVVRANDAALLRTLRFIKYMSIALMLCGLWVLISVWRG